MVILHLSFKKRPPLFVTVSMLHITCSGCFLKLKYCDTVRRKRICKRIFLSVALLFDRLIEKRSRLSCAAILYIITVQDQSALFSSRNTHAVISSLHRCKVADKKQILLVIF